MYSAIFDKKGKTHTLSTHISVKTTFILLKIPELIPRYTVNTLNFFLGFQLIRNWLFIKLKMVRGQFWLKIAREVKNKIFLTTLKYSQKKKISRKDTQKIDTSQES